MMGTFRDFFLPLMPPLPVNTPHLKVTLAPVDIFIAGFVTFDSLDGANGEVSFGE